MGISVAAKNMPVYNDLKIEIQIRSRLQHAWATASEVISTFTGQALKSNIGDESWKRFFKLMGSELAIREGRHTVPDTPPRRDVLLYELRTLVRELQVEKLLSGHVQAVKIMTEKVKNAHTYLLILNAEKMELHITSYKKQELPQAQRDYIEIEKETANNTMIQAVLIWGRPIQGGIPSAYPNYYLDAEEFLRAVHTAIGNNK